MALLAFCLWPQDHCWDSCLHVCIPSSRRVRGWVKKVKKNTSLVSSSFIPGTAIQQTQFTFLWPSLSVIEPGNITIWTIISKCSLPPAFPPPHGYRDLTTLPYHHACYLSQSCAHQANHGLSSCSCCKRGKCVGKFKTPGPTLLARDLSQSPGILSASLASSL